MSRLKEALAYGANSGRWADATRTVPCPICGATSWCGVSPDGSVVLCKRVEGERHGVTRDGVTYHLHRLRDTVAPARAPEPRPFEGRRAPVEICDRAYRALLVPLRLDNGDREALRARGLSDGDINENGYRTLPPMGRARLARALVGAVGEQPAAQVPGVFWRMPDDGGDRGWWSIAGAPGLLVPVRDVEGRIVALKVRRRDSVDDGPRYHYVTSARRGGAPASNALHVPLRAAALRAHARRLVVTEGELKADVATSLLGEPVVSIPGVGAWRSGVALARSWGTSVVVIALDMDAERNVLVAQQRQAFREALARAGLDARVWSWPANWKGLDDFLAATRRGEVDYAS